MPNGENKLLTVINVYCPRLRNDPDDPVDNTDFKYTFHNTLGKRAKSLVAAGSFVIVMGDFNIAHKPIDRVEADDSEVTFYTHNFSQNSLFNLCSLICRSLLTTHFGNGSTNSCRMDLSIHFECYIQMLPMHFHVGAVGPMPDKTIMAVESIT